MLDHPVYRPYICSNEYLDHRLHDHGQEGFMSVNQFSSSSSTVRNHETGLQQVLPVLDGLI
jgi:hypothetical protein